MAVPLPVLDVLEAITIPTHCPIPWDGMRGNDRTRHCSKCNEAVHDVSALTTLEVVALLSGQGRPPCLRLYRRRDGRVMTADCPASRRERVWRWLRPHSARTAAVFAFFFLSGCKTATQGVMVPDYLEAQRNAGPRPESAVQPQTPTVGNSVKVEQQPSEPPEHGI